MRVKKYTAKFPEKKKEILKKTNNNKYWQKKTRIKSVITVKLL